MKTTLPLSNTQVFCAQESLRIHAAVKVGSESIVILNTCSSPTWDKLVPDQEVVQKKLEKFSQQYSRNREAFARRVTSCCSREDQEQQKLLHLLTDLGHASTGKENLSKAFTCPKLIHQEFVLGIIPVIYLASNRRRRHSYWLWETQGCSRILDAEEGRT